MSAFGGGAAAGAARAGTLAVTGESEAIRLFTKGLRTDGTHTRMSVSPVGDMIDVYPFGWCLYASYLSAFEEFTDMMRTSYSPTKPSTKWADDNTRKIYHHAYCQQFVRFLATTIRNNPSLRARVCAAIITTSSKTEINDPESAVTISSVYGADDNPTGHVGQQIAIKAEVGENYIIRIGEHYKYIDLGKWDIDGKRALHETLTTAQNDLLTNNPHQYLELIDPEKNINIDNYLLAMWQRMPGTQFKYEPLFYGDYSWFAPVVRSLFPWLLFVSDIPMANVSSDIPGKHLLLRKRPTEAHFNSTVFEYVPPEIQLGFDVDIANTVAEALEKGEFTSVTTLEKKWIDEWNGSVPTPSGEAAAASLAPSSFKPGFGPGGIPLGASPVLVKPNEPSPPIQAAAEATAALMGAVAAAAERLQGGDAPAPGPSPSPSLPSAGAAGTAASPSPAPAGTTGEQPAGTSDVPAPAPSPAVDTGEPVTPASSPAPAVATGGQTVTPVTTPEPAPAPAPSPEPVVPPVTPTGAAAGTGAPEDFYLGPMTADEESALDAFIKEEETKAPPPTTFADIPPITPSAGAPALPPALPTAIRDLNEFMKSLPPVPTGNISVSSPTTATEHPLIILHAKIRAYMNAIYEEVTTPGRNYTSDLLREFLKEIDVVLINLTVLEMKADREASLIFTPPIPQTRREINALKMFIEGKIDNSKRTITLTRKRGGGAAAGAATGDTGTGQSPVTGGAGQTPTAGGAGGQQGSSVTPSGDGGPPSPPAGGGSSGVSDLNARLTELEGRVTAVEGELGALRIPSTELAAAKTEISTLRTQLEQSSNAVTSELGKLRGSVARLQTQGGKISNLEDSIYDITAQLAALQPQVPQVTQADLTALRASIAALEEAAKAERQHPVVGGGAAGGGAAAEIMDTIEGFRSGLNQLEDAVMQFDEQQEELSQRIDTLSAQLTAAIGQLTTQIAAETGRAQEVEATLAGAIAAERQRITDVSGRLLAVSQWAEQRDAALQAAIAAATAAAAAATQEQGVTLTAQIGQETAARQAAQTALEQRLVGLSGEMLNRLTAVVTDMALLRASVGGLQAAARAASVEPGVLASRRSAAGGLTPALLPTSGRLLGKEPPPVAGLLPSWLNPNPAGACTESLLSTGDCTASHIVRDICGFDVWVRGWIGGGPRLGNATQLAYARDISGGVEETKMKAAYPDRTIYIDGSSYVVRNPYATLGERLAVEDPGFFMQADVSGGLGLNMQVLQAYAPRGVFGEFLTDNKRAIAVLEALWHCGRSGGHDGSPQCYPARVIEELREYNLLKEQSKSQALAQEALKLGGWSRVSGYLSKAVAMLPKTFGRAAPPPPAPAPAPSPSPSVTGPAPAPLPGGAGGAASGNRPAIGSTAELLLGLGIGARRGRALPFREIIPDLTPGLGFHPS